MESFDPMIEGKVPSPKFDTVIINIQDKPLTQKPRTAIVFLQKVAGGEAGEIQTCNGVVQYFDGLETGMR